MILVPDEYAFPIIDLACSNGTTSTPLSLRQTASSPKAENLRAGTRHACLSEGSNLKVKQTMFALAGSMLASLTGRVQDQREAHKNMKFEFLGDVVQALSERSSSTSTCRKPHNANLCVLLICARRIWRTLSRNSFSHFAKARQPTAPAYNSERL